MSENLKSETAYKTIGEIAKELNLVDEKTGNLKTYILRYWETQFKQIRPTIKAGKRRYYSEKDLKTIKYIKFLLKDKGYTINGVKALLNKNKDDFLDDINKFGVYKPDLKSKKIIEDKIKKISKIVKDIKKFK
jgi:DNA-binding transcriptional MerR regulator